MEGNSYYYPKKVKEELKRVRDRIARKHRDEKELRKMFQFVEEFLIGAKEINYEKSTKCNWDAILVVITRAMQKFQQTRSDKISFDANHMTHYVCFCREKKNCSNHFFATTDKNLYGNREIIQRDICKTFEEQIQINIVSIWNF